MRNKAYWKKMAKAAVESVEYYRDQRDELVEVVRCAAYNLSTVLDRECSEPVIEAHRMLASAFVQYYVPD